MNLLKAHTRTALKGPPYGLEHFTRQNACTAFRTSTSRMGRKTLFNITATRITSNLPSSGKPGLRLLHTYDKFTASFLPKLSQLWSSIKGPYGWGHFPQKIPDPGVKDKSEKKEEEKEEKKSSNNDNKNPFGGFSLGRGEMLALGLAGLIIVAYLAQDKLDIATEIDWNYFHSQLLARGKVKKLDVINNETVRVYVKDSNKIYKFKIGSIETFDNNMELIQRFYQIPLDSRISVVYHQSSNYLATVAEFVPGLIVLFVMARWIMKSLPMGRAGGGRGIFSFGKSNAKLFNKQDKVTTTFNDVAGLPEAKQEVQEFVDFLKNPKKYQDLGAKIPKGAILVGPPGTGKTLLAKAAAGEASVPFFSTSGSDFLEMYVGVGPARVRDLFQQARENNPCIVFIDEIDAIGRARGRSGMAGGNDERENTLNQILVEMDGFTPNTGVVVLAGTNRPDILDKALLRPGRFDRQITIDKPDIKSREEIFAVHLKPLKLDDISHIPEYAKRLAALTPGFSGADIANACNEAALIAARRRATAVTLKDLESALDRVMGGLEKKNKVLSPKEKKTVAFHEAGHVVAGWFLEHADPVLKVSIVPRGGGALGYTQYLPDDHYILQQEKLSDMMCVTLGGRVAEELIFGSITTGAQDDLDKVTRLAYSQVKLYGMSDKIGPLSFSSDEHSIRPYSDETALIMDEEARKLIQTAYARTVALLTEKRAGLEALAQQLIEKEVIGLEEIKATVGARPWKTEGTAKDFIV